MRVYVGPWFWVIYLGLTTLLLLVVAGTIYVASLMQAACT